MSYLVLSPQERQVDIVDTPEQAAIACGTHISHPVVLAWCERAATCDVLQDDGVGRGRRRVVKLGEVTDVAAMAAKVEAQEKLIEAVGAVGAAVEAAKRARP